MPFNINISGLTASVKTQLVDRVTSALQGAQAPEQDTVKMIGQVINFRLGQIDDDHLLDINASGNADPTTGEETLVLSFRSRPTKPVQPATPAVAQPWTPDQGPLFKSTEPSPAPADPASGASVAKT